MKAELSTRLHERRRFRGPRLAEEQGWPEECLHREYFTVPGDVEYENHAFQVTLASSGVQIEIPADKSAADVLIAVGVQIDVKCSDGLCGTCVAEYSAGEVEHRDYVLSNEQRKTKLTLCCSRASAADSELTLKL